MPQVAQGVSYVAPIYSAAGNMLDVWASKSPTFARGLAQTGFKTGLQGVGVLGFTINIMAIGQDVQSNNFSALTILDVAAAVVSVVSPYGWVPSLTYMISKEVLTPSIQNLQQQINTFHEQAKNPLFWMPSY